jgi:hypothetical protein
LGKIDPSLSRPVAMAATSIMCRTIVGGVPTEQSLNGLPKPWLTAGDDEAYGRFLRHRIPESS